MTLGRYVKRGEKKFSGLDITSWNYNKYGVGIGRFAVVSTENTVYLCVIIYLLIIVSFVLQL